MFSNFFLSEMWLGEWLGEWLVIGYLGMLTIAWCLMVLGASRWGKGWHVSIPTHSPVHAPSVSVCIPARNEAANIGNAVRNALQSVYPNLEVIVVDDRSDDGTGAIAMEAGKGDARLRVISGTEPNVGWAGKPWACLRAAKESKGAWLIFVDADVCLHPKTVQSLVDTAKEHELAMLSYFGTWELGSFWEKVLIPAVGWLIRGAVNFDKVNSVVHVDAFANGQLIAMRRDAYFSIGGHGAVRNQVLEDVRLAEVMKRNGFATQIRPAKWAFSVRLYRSLGEIINGYTKNLYEGLGRKAVVGFGAALFLFVCALLPYILAVVATIGRLLLHWEIVSWVWLGWLYFLCAIQIVFRYQQEKMDDRSGWIAWTQPIANCLLIWILLRSTMKVSVQWKGRSFVDGKAQ